jgi:peptidoglycan/LPS O-acetylase OafA/YrhL
MSTKIAMAGAAPSYRLFGSYRLLLAVLVLISHGGHGGGEHGRVLGLLGLGNGGVFLFFVVSGFVISEALDLFYRNSIGKFALNRCLKIFPGYWAATIIAYIAYALVGVDRLPAGFSIQLPTDSWAILVNITMVLSYLKQGNNLVLLSLTWAVVIEIMFYGLAALSFFVAAKTRKPAITLGIAAIVALCFYVFVWSTNSQTRFFGAFQFAPYFVLGSALYFFAKQKGTWQFLLMGTSFLLSVHAFYIYSTNLPVSGQTWLSEYGLQWNVLFSTGVFICGAGLFARLITARTTPKGEWIDKRFGDITYSVYLVHMPFVMLASHFSLTGLTRFSFIVVVAFGAAIAINRYVERPFMGLRDRFRGRRLYD